MIQKRFTVFGSVWHRLFPLPKQLWSCSMLLLQSNMEHDRLLSIHFEVSRHLVGKLHTSSLGIARVGWLV